MNKALGGSNVSNYATGPLGKPPIGPQTSNTHINPQLTQTTHVNMYGVGDGHEELGVKVARLQNKVNADLIRNMQTASVA